MSETELAIRNIPRGWKQVTEEDTVREGDMTWNTRSQEFELEYANSSIIGTPTITKWCVIRKDDTMSTIRDIEMEKERARKNIPEGWVQVSKSDIVQVNDMLWTSNSKRFELENSASSHIGTSVSDKLCCIREQEAKETKVKFKSLKKVLKENPDLILTEQGALATQGQIRVGIVTTLSSIWTAKLGEDFIIKIPSLVKDLKRFIEREYDDTHMLTWDRIDKTKESWITVRELLNDKDYEGTKIQLEQLRDHMAIIISKLHDYDKKVVNKDKRIDVQDRRIIEKDKIIDSMQRTLNMSKNKYEDIIRDLKGQIGSINSNSREAIMKRKFVKILKT